MIVQTRKSWGLTTTHSKCIVSHNSPWRFRSVLSIWFNLHDSILEVKYFVELGLLSAIPDSHRDLFHWTVIATLALAACHVAFPVRRKMLPLPLDWLALYLVFIWPWFLFCLGCISQCLPHWLQVPSQCATMVEQCLHTFDCDRRVLYLFPLRVLPSLVCSEWCAVHVLSLTSRLELFTLPCFRNTQTSIGVVILYHCWRYAEKSMSILAKMLPF